MNTNGAGSGRRTIVAFSIGFLLIGGAIPAWAGLGGDSSSIESDAVAMAGKVLSQTPPASAQSMAQPSTQPSGAFSTQSFVTGSGVTVSEYYVQSGPVFGVAWNGRRPPDLSVLLGSYYPEYLAAARTRKGLIGLHHDVIAGPHSIVVLSGHMGSLSGYAYAPSLAPPGIDPKAVAK